MENAYHHSSKIEMNEDDNKKYAEVWQRVRASETAAYVQGGMKKSTMESMPQEKMQYAEDRSQINSDCIDKQLKEAVQEIKRFILEELEDRCFYFRFACCAPNKWAAQTLVALATEEGCHARKLMATYFLMTGTSYCPHYQMECYKMPSYCDGLRMRFEEECNGAQSYLKAAEETNDPCMRELYQELAEGEYSHTKVIRELLECMIPG